MSEDKYAINVAAREIAIQKALIELEEKLGK